MTRGSVSELGGWLCRQAPPHTHIRVRPPPTPHRTLPSIQVLKKTKALVEAGLARQPESMQVLTRGLGLLG